MNTYEEINKYMYETYAKNKDHNFIRHFVIMSCKSYVYKCRSSSLNTLGCLYISEKLTPNEIKMLLKRIDNASSIFINVDGLSLELNFNQILIIKSIVLKSYKKTTILPIGTIVKRCGVRAVVRGELNFNYSIEYLEPIPEALSTECYNAWFCQSQLEIIKLGAKPSSKLKYLVELLGVQGFEG